MRFLNSVKSLYTAVGILFLTVALGAYVDFENEAMHARHLEINTGLEKMVRLNQELTNMLAIAVLKQNALAGASYDTVRSDLDLTMKTVADLTQQQNLLPEISGLIGVHGRLRVMEEHVIKLMSADNWTEATNILFGDEYVLARKTYEVDSETAVGAVKGELAATVERYGTIRTLALALRVGALLLLLWVGVMFSRRTRADLAEQMRLRDEITKAYEAMEERVRERTADLEASTRRLAIENEERMQSDAPTRLILNSAAEGIFGVDAEERVIFFNDAASRLLGYSADELIGKEIHAIVHHSRADGTPYPREDCPMVHACTHGQGKQVSGEVLWRKDGSRFLSEYSVTPISDGKDGGAGAVIVFRDITEQRNNQEELQRRMEELERFNRITMDREGRMIQLKREYNSLLEGLGREKKYKVYEEEER